MVTISHPSPLVSIIIPCYRQAEFLPDALNSVLAQTFEDWECIIVNDGSPNDDVYRINEVLAFCRVKSESRSTQVWANRAEENFIKIYEKHKKKYELYQNR